MCTFLGPGSGTAIIAVIGTLGGAALGGGFTYWQQKRQREHEDVVRFHQVRLDAYDKFYSGVLNVVGSVAGWYATQPNVKSLAEAVNDEAAIVMESYPRVRLVGSRTVVKAGLALHDKILEFTDPVLHPDVSSLASVVSPLAMTFEAAVRRELGTDREV